MRNPFAAFLAGFTDFAGLAATVGFTGDFGLAGDAFTIFGALTGDTFGVGRVAQASWAC